LEAARKLQKKGVAVPYSLPLPTEETNWKVAFEPPGEINLVGSWSNQVSVKPKDGLKVGVDLAIEMPNVSGISFVVLSSLNIAPVTLPGKGLHEWAFFPQKIVLPGHNRRGNTEDKVRPRS
jgi:hypothetical protein